ncbi:homeobox-leucine zipper protein HOX20-like [Humulus lupulus]|uniref:homeobox-leucine zipper protein HOX20-like n=1 Tax=Humulus lupulus TaxID=3486 RepID=UPI002B412B1C|nr:homeobox-leucine zipper protein HOX20-like [Humulus lupulus]
MDWNISNARRGVSRTGSSSYGFPFHKDYDSHYQGMERKPHQLAILSEIAQRLNIGPCMEKKKRTLSKSQLESLERSFQEGVKLEPDKKMKLSRDLGLEPRQIAVWYQNKRARLKTKQIERSYEALKHEFDRMSKEKQKLQKEVVKLKCMLRDQNASGSKQVPMSGNSSMISREDMAESTADAIISGSSNMSQGTNNHHHHHHHIMAYHQCNHIFNKEEHSPISPPYWGFFP